MANINIFAVLATAGTVFLVVNAAKRLPQVPSRFVPHLSFLLAFALTAVWHLIVFRSPLDQALVIGAEAAFAGAIPIGGHVVLKPIWVALFGEASADAWLGQADPPALPGFHLVLPKDQMSEELLRQLADHAVEVQQKDKTKPPKIPLVTLLVVGLAVFSAGCLTGCAYLPEIVRIATAILADVSDAQSKLDTVEAMVILYFSEHPDKDAEKKVAGAIARCRQGLELASQGAKGTKELGEGDYNTAFNDFALAWTELEKLLGDLGILGSDYLLASRSVDGELRLPTPVALAGRQGE